MKSYHEQAGSWIDAYKTAWEISDGDAAALLFREDCICRTMPFRPVEAAQAYQRQAMASQTAKQVWFGEPIVSGNQVAVEYWAILFDLDEKQDMTLVGQCRMKLDDDGRCYEFRDYWHMQPGSLVPHEEWGK